MDEENKRVAQWALVFALAQFVLAVHFYFKHESDLEARGPDLPSHPSSEMERHQAATPQSPSSTETPHREMQNK